MVSTWGGLVNIYVYSKARGLPKLKDDQLPSRQDGSSQGMGLKRGQRRRREGRIHGTKNAFRAGPL